jgi:hypothetical protein
VELVMMKAVYRKADNAFICAGFYDTRPTGDDYVTYGVVDLPGSTVPDLRLERYDAASPTKRRAATADELAAYDAAATTSLASATSHQKDILATCALIVRARGIAAWNAMTTQQKVAATLAEADTWRDIRVFIDDKL